MKYAIKTTYKVNGFEFSACALTPASAYRHVCAIVLNEQLSFPKQDETLSEYMKILTDIADGKAIKHENHIFALERISIGKE